MFVLIVIAVLLAAVGTVALTLGVSLVAANAVDVMLFGQPVDSTGDGRTRILG